MFIALQVHVYSTKQNAVDLNVMWVAIAVVCVTHYR